MRVIIEPLIRDGPEKFKTGTGKNKNRSVLLDPNPRRDLEQITQCGNGKEVAKAIRSVNIQSALAIAKSRSCMSTYP
jgi:hypothetical protein